jgi:hypothetical protein
VKRRPGQGDRPLRNTPTTDRTVRERAPVYSNTASEWDMERGIWVGA